MTELQKWNLVQSEMVINHRWCKVRRDEIELPNGKVVDDFFVHIKPDIAFVLAITPNNEVIFVRQYRYARDDFFIEIPAGGFNAENENPETAALRELEEETGYSSQNIKKIATLYNGPSKDTNQLHLFLAQNAVKVSEQNLDITEEIEVLLIPIDEIVSKIESGEISVVSSVAALFFGLNFLKTQK
ncbi:NUDIX hydrolase [Dulcicalothrix desertica PCC 7102]|uniref:NUDIX hydrolase n=1 Tax=Dulcicalothrix desertica PCC 7102 TaxID=232991 RepID=A0A3S1AL37_9CYAN|nr:NUDIX hydrolase [Dulcicalothrix desertica]RUT03495.1 NUDIX hydrolase [Dulcicalothrix desertica PCC 7102]TWH50581.1 NTP pyrophosphohydrolases including oxidative damage repair enzymes [Dulcicalothrix desertica PCC 7102]